MARSDRFLKACRREAVDCTPIWLMRQAGRYLEEYRAIRKGHSFIEMCTTPELAAEVTLQPVRRFDLDAAIIFSDILLPLQASGVDLTFTDSEGPRILKPVRTGEDVERMRPLEPEQGMTYLLDAIRLVRRELDGSIPLIGFCGAPFTLASYLVEGGGSKTYTLTKQMMYTQPDLFHRLMERVTDIAIACANGQIRHGAQAFQVFDSWVGTLSRSDYEEFVFPYTSRLFSSLDRSVPSIHFALHAFHMTDLVKRAGGDVIGIDWQTPLDVAWQALGPDRAIQGNLDPAALFGSSDYLHKQVRTILAAARDVKGHIFNLGHGILPGTPPENVAILVDLVHRESARPL